MDYSACYELQQKLAEELIEGRREDTILFVEHPPVLTLGASFHEANLLHSREAYAEMGIAIESTDRGGDVTFHNPGQLVIYPIVDIAKQGKDLHKWMRDLEECMLLALKAFGLEGRRFPPHTGAWVGDAKIAAIGVKVRKWVNLHGIALNCNNDLQIADEIIPCGIQGYGVTSLAKELGKDVRVQDTLPIVRCALEHVLGFTPLEIPKRELTSAFLPEYR